MITEEKVCLVVMGKKEILFLWTEIILDDDPLKADVL